MTSLAALSVILAAALHTKCAEGVVALTLRNEPDACTCLNWKETYASGVKCGDALELDTHGAKHFDVELCHDFPGYPQSAFFFNQDHRLCINRRKAEKEQAEGSFANETSEFWCYVSSACTDLQGGSVLRNNPDVSYKMCGESDKTLAELPPAELFALSTAMDPPSDAQMMVLMAYEWVGPGERHDLLKWTGLPPVGSDARTKPLLGGSAKEDTFTVVYGEEVWEVHDGPSGTCVQGCQGAQAVLGDAQRS